MYYGYARISRPTQKIDRQISNITDFGKRIGVSIDEQNIYQEAFSGTKLYERKEFNRLLNVVQPNDTIIFDSVSRMSRNAEDGYNLYVELFNKNIHLIFLKEPQINTETYKQAIDRQANNKIEQIAIETGNKATTKFIQAVIEAINEFTLDLAKEQIRLAFVQAQAEVDNIHKLTKDGIKKAKDRGIKVGGAAQVGMKKKVKKSVPIKEMILKYSKDFKGGNNDIEVVGIIKQKLNTSLARNTYYKYKRELTEEINSNEL